MTTPTPTRLTARCTDDLLAMVPVALGFAPQDSVVLLSFSGDRPFHARVDLPELPEHDAALVEMLLGPALHHRVRHVAVLVYASPPRAGDAHRVGRRLVEALRGGGIAVVDAVRASDGRWHALLEPDDPGVPYDVSGHRFTAQAVLDGRALLASRDELAATLEPDPAAVARTVAVAAFVAPGPRPLTAVDVAGAVEDHLDGGRLPDEVLVRVLRAIRTPAVRDGAWVRIDRRCAGAHVRLWSDAVRRAPDDLRGSAAAVLALAAWMSGHGALAWCAVDRCRAVDPANSLASLVADGLQRAVPPGA